MKNWLNGFIWPGIEITANDSGAAKYWQDGFLYGNIFPSTPAAPSAFVPRVMWFT